MKKIAKGFTLIELLVVVGVIGLLATMAIVSYGNAQIRARDGKRVADMRAIISALNAAGLAEAQPVLCTTLGADLPAGQTRLSEVLICSNGVCNPGNCAGANDVTTKYLNFSNLHDPSNASVPCADPAAAVCDYAIQNGASIAGQAISFTVNFWTEGSNVAGLDSGQDHIVNENGLQ